MLATNHYITPLIADDAPTPRGVGPSTHERFFSLLRRLRVGVRTRELPSTDTAEHDTFVLLAEATRHAHFSSLLAAVVTSAGGASDRTPGR